jgi:hypothetical protein
MAKTPKSVTVEIDWDRQELKNALKIEHDIGFNEGLQKGLQASIDFLQDAYENDPGRPDRGSPKAEAILEMTRALGIHLRKKLKELKKNV